MRRRSCPTSCPRRRRLRRDHRDAQGNEIVNGKFLSDDGELALVVLALDRKAVQEQGAKQVIGNINALLDEQLKAPA